MIDDKDRRYLEQKIRRLKAGAERMQGALKQMNHDLILLLAVCDEIDEKQQEQSTERV